MFLVAKALAERYRSIIPEEIERLEGLAKVDKERFVLYFSFYYTFSAIFLLSQREFHRITSEEVRPARTIWK